MVFVHHPYTAPLEVQYVTLSRASKKDHDLLFVFRGCDAKGADRMLMSSSILGFGLSTTENEPRGHSRQTAIHRNTPSHHENMSFTCAVSTTCGSGLYVAQIEQRLFQEAVDQPTSSCTL